MPRSAAPEAGPAHWRLALAFVAAVTALRALSIAVTPLDLYTDEAQYWQWGQEWSLGYYSKPPLIGWLIGAVTTVLGTSDVTVRLPAPLLHGATAVLLGMLGHRLYGPTIGAWAAAAYVTVPMTAVGSFLISTDTVAFPFVAAALLLWLPAPASHGRAFAAGLLLGVGGLAKYAALYPIAGLALAAALGLARPGWTRAAIGLAGVLLALAPNLAWNARNGFVTAQHTAENADWGGTAPGLAGSATFLAAQAGVFGPILLAALLAAPILRPDRPTRLLACLAAPPLVLVTIQAWLSDANANWAVMAYLPGTIAAVAAMGTLARRASLILNGALCALLAALVAVPALLPEGPRTALLGRYEGRAETAAMLLARSDGRPLVAAERGLLADLFYHGRDAGIPLRSRPYEGFPPHHYGLVHPIRPGEGPAVFVAAAERAAPCEGAIPRGLVTTNPKAHGTALLRVWSVPEGCWE